MAAEKSGECRFVKKAALISAAAAVVLFIACCAVYKNTTRIILSASSDLAQQGKYSSAQELLGRIDRNSEPDAYNEGMYNIASAVLLRGDNDAAYELFSGLGDYSDSREKSYECIQNKARILIEAGEYSEASALLQDIMSAEGSEELYNECRYDHAVELIDSGEWKTGVQILWGMKDYGDAAEIAEKTVYEHTGSTDIDEIFGAGASLDPEQMREYIALQDQRALLRDGCIAVGFEHTAGLRSDGSVAACGANGCGQCDTGEWHDAVQITAGAYHTAALLSDGTVVACGDNTYGQCEVSGWTRVVQIAASDYNTYALLDDGTVVGCGFSDYPQTDGWRNITTLCAGSYSISGIALGGQLYSSHQSCVIDESLEDAAMSTAYTLGITLTGDIVCTADIPSDWTKALSVYACGDRAAIIGYGRTASVYDRRSGSFYQLPREDGAVSIALGGTHFAILYQDGSVECFGDNSSGQCDTQDWSLF